MLSPIAGRLAAITEDRRAAYLFSTKTAADAVGCVPNKFNDWWQRTRSKLKNLYLAQPGELAAELAVLIAEAEMQRASPSEPLAHPPISSSVTSPCLKPSPKPSMQRAG